MSEREKVTLFAGLLLTDAETFSVPTDSDKHKSFTTRLVEIFKHPFALLIISSMLIPLTIYIFNSYKSVRDSRQKKALEIISQSAEFEGRISSIYKDLTLFQEDNRELFKALITSPNDAGNLNQIKNRRERFQIFFNPRYSEFEKTGNDNLWVEDLYAEGVALQLFTSEDVQTLNSSEGNTDMSKIDPELKTLHENIDSYKKSFENTIQKIGDYKSNLINEPADTKKIFVTGSINDALNKQRKERKNIVQNLVKTFTPRSWWKI